MDETNDLSIKQLIRAVTAELLASQQERLACGDPAVFEVSELTLDISFVATHSRNISGGFDFKVVKADGGVKYDEQSVHRVILKLTAPKPRASGKTFGLTIDPVPVLPRETEQPAGGATPNAR
jgi:hypothetical protein